MDKVQKPGDSELISIDGQSSETPWFWTNSERWTKSRNPVILSEFLTTDKFQKPGDSEWILNYSQIPETQWLLVLCTIVWKHPLDSTNVYAYFTRIKGPNLQKDFSLQLTLQFVRTHSVSCLRGLYIPIRHP
jgi:hypothetical protein